MTRHGMAILAALTAAATTAGATETRAVVTMNWENTRTLDRTPLVGGDSARVWVDVAFEPPVGSPILTNVGEGVLGGFLALVMSLSGTGGTEGTWTNLTRQQPWTFGLFDPEPTGDIRRWEAGTFLQPHEPHPNPINPVLDLTSAIWTPRDGRPRSVEFVPRPAGTGVSLGGQIPSGFWASHQIDPANVEWRSVRVRLVPGPGVAVLLALASAAAMRRRR